MKCRRIGLWILMTMMFLTLLGCGEPITVHFEVNGGDPIADIVLEGSSFSTDQIPTPTKTGYTFEGWFYESDFSSEFDIAAILLGETTLYAKWTINHPTITFDVLGGSTVAPISQDYNTELIEPADPTKVGHTFGGWFTDAACTTEFTFATMPGEDTTLYAKWTIITYTVTFMADGALVATRTVNHGETITNIPTVPAKVGFGAAWDVMDFSNIIENKTVTAVYSDNYYTITFVNSLGDDIGTASVKHGDMVTEPTIPVVDGYNFVAWTGYSFTSPAPVSGPLTITATYQIKVFTVVFYGVTGTPIGESQQIEWGHAATAPTYTGQDGYVVTGWDKAFNNVTENLSVTATYTMVSYIVTFDENDGSAVADINAAYRSVITKPADPTRPGYVFAGWYSDEALTTEYVFTAQSTMPLSGMTLFANWDEALFTVTFNADGGSAVADRPIVFNALFGLLPTSTKTGYTLAGWYLEGEVDTKIESTTQYTATTNMTLTAHWAINPYTITFNVDGGTAVAPVTQDYDTAVTAPTAPTKAGYTFAGWYQEVGLTTAYVFSTIPAANITVYAKWTINAYTISFESNGGSSVSAITQDFATAVTAPAAPTKTGYSFGGWYKEAELTTSYTFATMPSASLTLYAKWNINSYTISFNVNGGSTVLAITQNYNTAVTAPTAPTKAGYSFAGWYQETELTNAYVFTTMPAENSSVYAKWTVNAYTITFDSNEGSAVTAITQNFGTAVTAPAIPTKVGYDFLVWCSDELLTVTYTFTTMPSGNITLYAKWKAATDTTYTVNYYALDLDNLTVILLESDNSVFGETLAIANAEIKSFVGFTHNASDANNILSGIIAADGGLVLEVYYDRNSYTITFDSNEGSSVSAIFEPFETLILAPTEPTRIGYTFAGWYEEEDPFTTLYAFTTMPSENITLYAKWTINQYTITFIENEGSLIDDLTAEYLSAVVAPTAPTRDGYTFLGWFDDVALETAYEFTTMPLNGNTIYAKWVANATTDYIVEYWQQNILDDEYTLADSNGLFGTTDTTATATINSYEGFAYEADNADAVISGNIAGDGSLVLKVFYVRITYTVELDYNDERTNTTFQVRHGGTLSALVDPVRTGNTFQGWVDELNTAYTSAAVVESSLYLFASWNAEMLTITVIRYYYASDGLTPIPGSPETITRSVTYGSTYAPTTSLTGNDFINLVINSETYTNADFSFVATVDTTLYVSFKVRTIYVTFIQNPTGSAVVGLTRTIDYNGTLADVDWPTARDGYTVVWDHTIFTNLTENMTVFAFYYENGVKTVTFMDAGTITAIFSQEGSATNVITADNLMWTPVKTGFRFDGWFNAAISDDQWTIEEMLWASVTTNLTLVAHWIALEAFPAPTGVAVTTGTQIVTWTQGKVNDVYPSSYSILVDGTLHTILASNCIINEVTGAVSYAFVDGILLKVGTHTVIVTALGDGINQISGLASETATIIIETSETENPGEVTETKYYDYFIVEKTENSAIYLFYSDMVYNFVSGYQLTILSGDDCVTALNNKLTTKSVPGSFRFSVKTISTGETKTYFGKVITNINQFALDTNLSKYNIATLAAYEDKTLHPYLVGSSNPFHFDLKILDNIGNRVDQNACELIYTFSLWNTGTGSYDVLSTTLSTYVTVLANQEFQFSAAAVGQKFKVQVSPKYQTIQIHSDAVQFEFTVNDGYNVFTNAELQLAFANFAIENINIHSDITCELRPDQMNADGSPKNGSFVFDGSNNYISGGAGAVYARLGATTPGSPDNLVVNGNYFTIDGSDLPYMNVNSDPTGEWKNVGFAKSFVVVDSRIGIFNYAVDPFNSINDNSLEMNNLTIIGNTVTPSVNYNLSAEEIASAEALMSLNSGGYNGIVLKSGTNRFTNVNIGMTVMGFFSTALGYKTGGTIENFTYIDYVHIYESWASSFLGYAISGLVVTNSNIDTSGGAAIHIEDAYSDGNDPEVFIDTATTVDNWISGQEAWFKVYGMTPTVTSIKSGIQTGILPLGKSIVKTIESPTTGLQTEMINFIMFQLPREGAYTQVEGVNVTGSQVSFNIPDANELMTNIYRPFDFMDTDPRDSGGSFVFPVGIYSDLSTFGAAVASLMGEYGVSQSTAGQIVSIDAFFNLSGLNPYLAGAGMNSLDMAAWVANNAATYGGVPGAITAFITTYSLPMPPQPNYLEVQAALPTGKVEGGVASVILGLYDPE